MHDDTIAIVMESLIIMLIIIIAIMKYTSNNNVVRLSFNRVHLFNICIYVTFSGLVLLFAVCVCVCI